MSKAPTFWRLWLVFSGYFWRLIWLSEARSYFLLQLLWWILNRKKWLIQFKTKEINWNLLFCSNSKAFSTFVSYLVKKLYDHSVRSKILGLDVEKYSGYWISKFKHVPLKRWKPQKVYFITDFATIIRWFLSTTARQVSPILTDWQSLRSQFRISFLTVSKFTFNLGCLSIKVKTVSCQTCLVIPGENCNGWVKSNILVFKVFRSFLSILWLSVFCFLREFEWYQ